MFTLENSTSIITAVKAGGAAAFGWAQTPLSTFLIRGADTQGQAAVIEAIQVKGLEPPRHSHPEADETYYVIAGKMTFFIAGERISAPAGATVFIERGRVHSFVVETEMANTLILVTPAPPEKVQVRA
jgi:quercetin dioxygenase-like cupin family protein